MVTPLERGQTTLLSSLAHQRPPPGPRRGPKDKLKGQPRSQSKLPNSCLPRSQEQTATGARQPAEGRLLGQAGAEGALEREVAVGAGREAADG